MKKLIICIYIIALAINGYTQKREDPKFNCCALKDDTNLIKGKVNRGVDSTQTNTFIIDYDFQTGVYNRNNLKIKVHNPAAFKVSNINRMAYDINVKNTDSVLAATDLSGMSASFLALGLKLNTDITNSLAQTENVTAQLNNLSNDTKIGRNEVIIANPNKSNTSKIDSTLQDITTLNKIQLTASEILAINSKIEILDNNIEINTKLFRADSLAIETQIADATSNKIPAISALKNELLFKIAEYKKIDSVAKAEINSLKDLKLKKDSLLATYNKLKFDAFKKFEADYENFLASFEKVKYSYYSAVKAVKYYQQVAEASDNPILSLSIYNTKYRKLFEKIAIRIPFVRDKVEHFKAHYTDLEIFYKYLKYNPQLNDLLDFGGQYKLYANAEAFKLIADNMNTYATQVNLEQLLTKTAQTIVFLGLKQAYNITFDPIQASNDVVVFDIKINKKLKNSSEIFNNRNFTHSEFTYGGTRLDFSIGIAGSYFNQTPVYELSTMAVKDSTSVIKINQKANQLTVPSLVLLTTMSYRKAGYVAFGGSAGLGVDVNNGKIQLSNFFVGPSVLFGKFERMMFTAGASIRNVGQLKSGYKSGNSVAGGSSDVNTYISDKYKIGTFIAITYHLTKKAKSNLNNFIK